jgi:tetratricopeptide (TPR) repeat protein
MKQIILISVFSIVLNIKTDAQAVLVNYTPPKYKGGREAYFKYAQKYMQFPIEINKPGTEAIVNANIYVDKFGKVKLVTTHGKTPVFNAEVKRVLKLMPDWEPAILNNENRDTLVSKIVRFILLWETDKKNGSHGDTCQIEAFLYQVPLAGEGFKEIPPEQKEKIRKEEKEKQNKMEIARLNYNEGVKLVQENKLEEALAKYNIAIENGGNKTDFLYNRGVVYFKLGQKEKACEDMKEAYRLNDTEAGINYEKYCK